MIHACITITVDSHRRNEAIRALRAMVEPTRAEPGCLECSLYCDEDDDARLCFVEEWRSQAELRRRLRSKAYLDLLEVVEMSTAVPQIRFDEIASRRGIDLVHQEREGAP